MKKNTFHSGFTLIELIVSIAIFGIMMISVMSIFLFSSQMSTRVEINRIMQENIKNVMEDIAESVRKDTIVGIQDSLIGGCDLPTTFSSGNDMLIKTGKIFCTDVSKYALGKKQADGSFAPVSDVSIDCGYDVSDLSTIGNQCYFLKSDISGGGYYPLTNSFVTFENIQFIVSNIMENKDTKKVTLQMTLRPAIRKGIASNLVRANTIQVQTTLSERFIETN